MKKTLLALAVSGAVVSAPGLVHALEAKFSGQTIGTDLSIINKKVFWSD